jgi:hypothetical protein
MSFLNGDRARAHKVDRKRRFRRSELRILRRVSAPALDLRGQTAVTEIVTATPKPIEDAEAPV